MGETITRYHVGHRRRRPRRACSPRSPPPSPSTASRSRPSARRAAATDAQLVVVSHRATDAALARPSTRCAAHGRRPRRHLGDAGRRRRPRTVRPPVARRHRGVPRPPRPVPRARPSITLREGGTPLVHAQWLSGLTGAEVWLKVEGDNPTGSFKDRGMTVAISVAARGRRGRRLRLAPATPPPSTAAYAAKAGLKPLRARPRGQDRRGQAGPGDRPRRHSCIMVDGNFDDCLDMARELAEHYPVALVNSVNPVRIEGQKTGRLRDRRRPRRRPRLPRAARSATPATSPRTGRATASTPRPTGPASHRAATARCGASRPPARRRSSPAHPVADPETIATAIRIGNPASWRPRRGARATSPAA